MSHLPVPFEPGRDPLVRRAAQARQKTELAIYQEAQVARFKAEVDRLESESLKEAIEAALSDELSLLEWGLKKAQGSQAAAELVSRKVSLLSGLNSARIEKRWQP